MTMYFFLDCALWNYLRVEFTVLDRVRSGTTEMATGFGIADFRREQQDCRVFIIHFNKCVMCVSQGLSVKV